MPIETLPIEGTHTLMSPEEVNKLYSEVLSIWEKHLKSYGVTFPKFATKKMYWLVYLYKYRGRYVHKDTISAFVNNLSPKSGKDQQVRHLAADGWYILNRGEKLPDSDEIVPSGYHLLYSLEILKPNYQHKLLKRFGRLAAKSFDELKAAYGFKCATCGSEEGKPQRYFPDKVTQLQQGHMNPCKALTVENSIPQCQQCNQTMQDMFEFNDKGLPVKLAGKRLVESSTVEVKKEIYNYLKREFEFK